MGKTSCPLSWQKCQGCDILLLTTSSMYILLTYFIHVFCQAASGSPCNTYIVMGQSMQYVYSDVWSRWVEAEWEYELTGTLTGRHRANTGPFQSWNYRYTTENLISGSNTDAHSYSLYCVSWSVKLFNRCYPWTLVLEVDNPAGEHILSFWLYWDVTSQTQAQCS